MHDERSVFQARDHLLAEGFVPEHLESRVRPDVLTSWRRSLVSGARPEAALEYRGDASVRSRLLSAAEPILANLAEQMGGMEAGLLLADREASIVRRWVADSAIRPLLDTINSDVGFNVGEEVVGTNGVGTVIESEAPVQISGPEHLAVALSRFTCVGVPVRHPVTRRLEGVITLSCRADATNPLLTPLMTSTARDIEHRMLEQASMRERRLLDAYVSATGSRRGPVAVVGQDLLIAGPQVTERLADVDQTPLWEYVRAAAGGSHDPSDYAERLGFTHCELVEGDRGVIGAVVEFDLTRREPERVAAHHRSQAHAAPLALPGRSAALAAAVTRTTRLVDRGAPILVVGETGVGKLTLATAALSAAEVPEGQRESVDAAMTGTEATEFVDAVRTALDHDPTALVLRHLETLSPAAAAAGASYLERRATDPGLPQVVATITPPRDAALPRDLQRLVDVVGTSRVVLPPLRERREDISEAAVARLARHSRRSMTFSSGAMRTLTRAPWPGNLRQLDGLVHDLTSAAGNSDIRTEDLPQELQVYATRRELSAMEELELQAISDALERHEGNKMAAARSLGISRSTLYRKLRSYHLDPDRQYF